MDYKNLDFSCDDFLVFQDSLKKMRVLDDKIIYELNTTVPTDLSRTMNKNCKQLYDELQDNYNRRDGAIRNCISVVSQKISELKTNGDNSIQSIKNIKKENKKLHLLTAELNIEEIIKERTGKIYYEKCRAYYKPSGKPDFV